MTSTDYRQKVAVPCPVVDRYLADMLACKFATRNCDIQMSTVKSRYVHHIVIVLVIIL
jgi:hypothetical protein